MSRIPDPKTIISSDAFKVWCESTDNYLKSFENELIQRIAKAQRRYFSRPRIMQALAPLEFLQQLKEKRLYPLVDPGKLKDKCLLFAPVSNSHIENLCRGKHAYTAKGHRLSVRLSRSLVFVEREKELSRYFGEDVNSTLVKEYYLPDLSFPFLPYSRKFLELELIGQYSPHDENFVREHFSAGDLLLQGGQTASDLNITKSLIPVWNVYSRKVTLGIQVGQTEKGSYVWHPGKKDEDFKEDDILIIHRALDRQGNPVKFTWRDRCLESELKPHVVECSNIKEVNQVPGILSYPVIGSKQPDIVGNFWYRTFLQSASLTQRDLDFLLSLLPETRGSLRRTEIQVENCSDSKFNDFVSQSRAFYDYLWYLDFGDMTRELGKRAMKVLSIHFEAAESDPKELDFLLEERANYFASICKLHLPMNIECKGYLRNDKNPTYTASVESQSIHGGISRDQAGEPERYYHEDYVQTSKHASIPIIHRRAESGSREPPQIGGRVSTDWRGIRGAITEAISRILTRIEEKLRR